VAKAEPEAAAMAMRAAIFFNFILMSPWGRLIGFNTL
jgi:hypothetical protein